MQTYVGCKIVRAEPMEEIVSGDRIPRPGYKVVYPDNYVSWSPKDVFEEAYRLIFEKEELLLSLETVSE